ncbi:sigma 54-interacting transcriptional regulator [Desulfitobacterium sp.]|uniref:sigma 54-interacting transcriptional regulator n=1 Tax=Desulfitobacterium sp. TaxID=49981 RepID=UPI002C117B24|nr:sigma 54-interacting transcriptional regulator [Desulfitobacterium sp.]HVJ48963.1 sigma 54-interacting transcriptional regulator [Desulfitobacterium sp.]
MPDILFLAPYPDIAQVAQKICEGTNDITIAVARMDEAVERARAAEQNKYHVLVSRGVTGWKIRNSGIALPLVEVSIGGYDIVRAYFEAKKMGKKIGIVDVEEVVNNLDIDSFAEIVDDTILKYTCCNDLEDISKGIQSLREQGVEVVMGKVAMANEARRQGMNSVVISSGLDSVRQAINEARRVNMVRKQEMKKAEQFKAILDFSYDGIIALDKVGKITVFNKAAEKASGWNAEKAIGKYITNVIPKAHCQKLLETGEPEIAEFLEIGETKVIANRVPIIVDNKVEGVVTTFQQIERLQKLEGKVRRKLADRGLVTKYNFDDILGNSLAIKNTINLASEYSEVDSTVLIHGQTGSGKEMFAHSIHNASKRKNEPFVAVNCAALPESLLESELFGYVEGAFTGARKAGKAGMFEMAHKGTLLLDEVGEMSPMLQARLLRVIEQGEVMRLGDSSIIPVDVRLIAATHRNLRQMVEQSKFREDLFFRLNVLSLNVPPLRVRGSDIILIAYKFLNEFCSRRGKPLGKFSAEVEDILLNYDWPGNLRELRNAMERLAMRSWQEEIKLEDISSALLLDEEISSPGNCLIIAKKVINKEIDNNPEQGFNDNWMSTVEKQVIKQVLVETGGNKTEAARRLGISRTTLWRKLQS